MKTEHLTIDYNNLTKAGTKKIISLFKKYGQEVIETDATGKTVRLNGQPTKQIHYIFQDGQNIALSVTPNGDIFKVTLNNSPIPVKNTHTIGMAIKEISQKVTSNRPKFKKKLSTKLNKIKLSDDVSKEAPTPLVVIGDENIETLTKGLKPAQKIDMVNRKTEILKERIEELQSNIMLSIGQLDKNRGLAGASKEKVKVSKLLFNSAYADSPAQREIKDYVEGGSELSTYFKDNLANKMKSKIKDSDFNQISQVLKTVDGDLKILKTA